MVKIRNVRALHSYSCLVHSQVTIIPPWLYNIYPSFSAPVLCPPLLVCFPGYLLTYWMFILQCGWFSAMMALIPHFSRDSCLSFFECVHVCYVLSVFIVPVSCYVSAPSSLFVLDVTVLFSACWSTVTSVACTNFCLLHWDQ